jgi:hypothetical protein
VFENRVLRRISGRREEVAGGWSRLHDKKLHNMYASPYIIRMIKTMRWVGHEAHVRHEKCIQNFGQKTCGEETTWKTWVQI